jgi:Tol biopolymer transport system component
LATPAYAAYPGKNGRIASEGTTYPSPYRGPRFVIWHFKPDGSDPRRIGPGKDYNPDADNENVLEHPEYSPSGKRIAFTGEVWDEGGQDIWVAQTDGSHWRRVTTHPASDAMPTWSPNGKRMAFVSSWHPRLEEPVDRYDLWTIRLDGSGLRRLTSDHLEEWSLDWAPDGSRLLYIRQYNGNELVSAARDGSDVQVIVTGVTAGAAYSPNGRWILYRDEYSNLVRARPDGTNPSVIEVQKEGLSVGVYPSWQPLTA